MSYPHLTEDAVKRINEQIRERDALLAKRLEAGERAVAGIKGLAAELAEVADETLSSEGDPKVYEAEESPQSLLAAPARRLGFRPGPRARRG